MDPAEIRRKNFIPKFSGAFQTQVAVSPSIQRDVCYSTGCYHLRGDGVTIPYSWVWVPAAQALPPGR